MVGPDDPPYGAGALCSGIFLYEVLVLKFLLFTGADVRYFVLCGYAGLVETLRSFTRRVL